MPTSPKVKRRLMEILPNDIDGRIYELGSGWGTLAYMLARLYPKSSVIGYETSPLPFYVSKIWDSFKRQPNLLLRREDFFKVSLKDASLVVCYLYPGAMERLKAKLSEELRPGTWVITHTFAIPGWKPHALYTVEDLYQTKIYVYKFSMYDT